ncbi:MAG: SDR family oxidoreductase [Nitrosomonas sp. PRO4]|nr:SDR family oxidoreductase [Nitrosomonas sp. PRO4]
MTQTLRGKTAIVTGSSRGIGAQIALTLAQAGAAVAVNYSKDKLAADKVCATILESGGHCLAVQGDVSKPAEVKKLFATVCEQFKQIDILVNNAGILLFKEITEIQDDEFDRIVDVNFKSVFYMLREAAAKLADHGRVVTISSTVTRLMLPKYGAYAATKAAVEQLTRIFAREMGKRGITANNILPGPVDTELFRAGKTAADIERMAEMAALGRIGNTNDIAQAVLFLVSEEARWVTGQNIGVNGGII